MNLKENDFGFGLEKDSILIFYDKQALDIKGK